jgi:hypothetical protein
VGTSDLSNQLQAFAGKRVFFGHQSVGTNIIEGIQHLAERESVSIRVSETRLPPADGAGGLFHFHVGENGAPERKLKDFMDTVLALETVPLDLAMLKFCYVDIDSRRNPAGMAASYIEMIESLRERRPSVTFVPVTAPLTFIQGGPKAWMKKLLGRTPAGFVDNANRQAFNENLRRHFSRTELFDLARVEAGPSAGRVESLDPRLSSDGGHLNANGQSVVAASLLQFLAA